MLRRALVLYCWMFFAVVATGFFVTSIAPRADAEDDDMAELMLGAEPVEIENLLRAVSKATGENIFFDPHVRSIRGRTIAGGVNVRVRKDRLFPVIRRILFRYGLGLQRMGPADERLWSVIELADAGAPTFPSPDVVDVTDATVNALADEDGRYVTTTMHVEHLTDLGSLRVAFKSLLTWQDIGTVAVVESARALVVTDFAPNVARIYRLLKRLDVPGRGNSTTAGLTVAIQLEHAKAVEVGAVLSAHYRGRGAGEDCVPAPGPRVTPHAGSNRILVTGTKQQVADVRLAVALLDVAVAPSKPR